MLNKELIIKANPVADEKQIFLWENYRITVLSDRLFRIENNEGRIFNDNATQAVWFRYFPDVLFETKIFDSCVNVCTKACRLRIDRKGSLFVELDGKTVKVDNQENLGGTYRTLDCCNGAEFFCPWEPQLGRKQIQLGPGVCSRSGVAYFDDQTLCIGADGEVKCEKSAGLDMYVFAYGSDYEGAIKALYDITGYTPIVPRFALGNWWSRYHVYTDKEYLKILNTFKERELPFTVATIDMDWHYSTTVTEDFSIEEKGMSIPYYLGDRCTNIGWTGYSWNKKLFSDYKAFLRKIKEWGYKITLNVHPSDGVRFWEDQYADFAAEMQISEKDKAIGFEFTNAKFINAYFDLLHEPYQKDGVDFWWIDWQQENIQWHDDKTAAGYDPLWALNHYHYLHNAKDNKTPLILSRYAGIGAHRYPLGFSGDTHITWDTLDYLPYFTATASNVGYSWWSHDIGGHCDGEKNDELYIRHIQFGVFSPINRLHCTCDEVMTKEPWLYCNGTGLIAEEFLKLRHKFIPYLYNASYLTHSMGTPLIRPLYYKWDTEPAFKYKNQYFFGSELMVIPITQAAKEHLIAEVEGWLPEGKWVDIFTGRVYNIGHGGKTLVLRRDLENIPVFAKEGAILVLSLDKGNSCGNPELLEINLFEGEGNYDLYEDLTHDNNGGCAFTKIKQSCVVLNGRCTKTVEVRTEGDYNVIPANREIIIRFKNVPEGQFTVYKDNEIIECEPIYTNEVAVRIKYDASSVYCVELEYFEDGTFKRFINEAKTVITRAAGNNQIKNKLWKALCETESIEQAINVIEQSGISEINKLMIKETLIQE